MHLLNTIREDTVAEATPIIIGLALLGLIVGVILTIRGRLFEADVVAVPVTVATTFCLFAEAEYWAAFAASVVGMFFAVSVRTLWTGVTR